MSDLGSDSCIPLFDKYMTSCLSVHVRLESTASHADNCVTFLSQLHML